MTQKSLIIITGARGDLGRRIVEALLKQGTETRILVPKDLDPAEQLHLKAMGAKLVAADPMNFEEMKAACLGGTCVVSALNGLRDVIIERQGLLLDAAVAAGVPRMISSDYAADFTKTRAGENRNFDLRREFRARADRAPIQVTSILNGAFMDMLGNEMPLIQDRIHRVLYWGSPDQQLDFTTKDDVAAFTARVAVDDFAPRLLRVAGQSASVRELAQIMTTIIGTKYRPLWAGSLGLLSLMIRVTKGLSGVTEDPFPAWQGMQYMRDQFSGRAKLDPLDNDRYPELRWTSIQQMYEQRAHRAQS